MQSQRTDDPRLDLLRRWLTEDLGWAECRPVPASEDASFRRYFRVTRGPESFVVMDAPPEKEDVEPYLQVAGMLADVGVHAPRILARSAQGGFVLLTDLGSTTYLRALAEPAAADALYGDAITALVRIQSRGGAHALSLPPYDERLLRFEMSLFSDWLVGRHLGVELSAADAAALGQVRDLLVANALEQPQVFVHRDYHSRNLMVCDGDNPGILDFQDAVRGPVSYDLVSLLRDCYVAWPSSRVRGWVERYRVEALAAGIDVAADETRFMRWFDLMGIQRHLKASGIFARLWHRDGKPGYLPDVPRTLGYIVQATEPYPELGFLRELVRERVLPATEAKLAGAAS